MKGAGKRSGSGILLATLRAIEQNARISGATRILLVLADFVISTFGCAPGRWWDTNVGYARSAHAVDLQQGPGARAMTAQIVELPLVQPKQERARRALQRILDATAELLVRVTPQAITTDLIADRADVNIATLYKYFPNKEALINYLALQFAQRQLDDIRTFVDRLGGTESWPEVMDGIIDTMVETSRVEPAAVPLQRAQFLVPELHEAYRRDNLAVARLLRPFAKSWGFTGNDDQWELVFMCLGETAAALLDLALANGRGYDRAVVGEMKKLFRGYLEIYLSKPGQPQVSPLPHAPSSSKRAKGHAGTQKRKDVR
ncbi:MAG: TetR/AcrR family transcriptional regulator [Geminicoccaceae bacterium]